MPDQHFEPGDGYPATTAFPQFENRAGANHPVPILRFDAASDEARYFPLRSYDYTSGDLTCDIDFYSYDGLTIGAVSWEAQIVTVKADENVEAGSFATVARSSTTISTTVRGKTRAIVTVTATDSLADGDLAYLRLARNADGTGASTDDMGSDAAFTFLNVAYA